MDRFGALVVGHALRQAAQNEMRLNGAIGVGFSQQVLKRLRLAGAAAEPIA